MTPDAGATSPSSSPSPSTLLHVTIGAEAVRGFAIEQPSYGCTVTSAVAERPKISGRYISSAWVGAAMKVPGAVARAT